MRKDLRSVSAKSLILMDARQSERMLWLTVSKAAERSNKISPALPPASMVCLICSEAVLRASFVLWWLLKSNRVNQYVHGSQ